MKVRDVPHERLVSVTPDLSLAEVARRMRKEDSDSLAIMDATVAAMPTASLKAGITTETPGNRKFGVRRWGFIWRRCLCANVISTRMRTISKTLAATRQTASAAIAWSAAC